MKINLMQIIRLVMMVLAVAGVIFAVEYLEYGIAVWFWVAVLGLGFVGLFYSFRVTQRRMALERRAQTKQQTRQQKQQQKKLRHKAK